MRHFIQTIFLLITLLLVSCSDSVSDKRSEKEISDSLAVYVVDSLGHPTWYTYPDINEISQLKKLFLSANTILAYNFNDSNGNPANVECSDLFEQPTNKICPSAKNKIMLTNSQSNKLISITFDTSTYTGKWSGLAGVCFIPHLGFGFFKNDSLIGQVNICFLCNGIRTRPYYRSDELSISGRQKLYDFAKELRLDIIDNNSKLTY